MKFFIIIILFLNFLSSAYAQTNSDLQAQINSLDERLTDTEMKDLLHKINLGIDLKVMTAHFSSQDNSASGSPQKVNQTSHALLFRLNMESSIAERVNVFASLESFSFFNDTFVSSLSNNIGSDGREYSKGTEKPRLIKAYFDWHLFPSHFTFSAGRLPTTQGPPAHMPDGVERTGTYPVLAYSVPLDGFAGTLNIHSFYDFFEKKKLIWRIIYKPGSATDHMFPWRGRLVGNENSPYQLSKSHSLLSSMIEYEHKELPSVWKNFLTILQFGHYNFGGMTPRNEVINLQSYGSGYWPAEIYADNDEVLKVNSLVHYFEFDKVLTSNFDLYGSWARTWSKSKAHIWAQPLPSSVASNAGLSKIDLGPYIVNGEKSGWRYLAGLRYEFKNKFFIGGEWAKSTADSLATTLWSDDVHTIAFINGESYHGYLTKILYKNQFTIRTGYVHSQMNKDLQGALLYKDSNEKIEVIYLNFLIHI